MQVGVGLTWKRGLRTPFGMMIVAVTQAYTFAKTQTYHLKICACFILYKLYLNKVDLKYKTMESPWGGKVQAFLGDLDVIQF